MTYFIEQKQLDQLRRIARTLDTGNDMLRDMGHRVRHIVLHIEDNQKLSDNVSVCEGETK